MATTINMINVGGVDREIEDTLARTKIDEIVAPSGGAPNPNEIIDARIGIDNTVYNSLGNSIRNQINGLKRTIDVLTNPITIVSEGWSDWTVFQTIPECTYKITVLSATPDGLVDSGIGIKNSQGLAVHYTIVSGSLPAHEGESVVFKTSLNRGDFIRVFVHGTVTIECVDIVNGLYEVLDDKINDTRNMISLFENKNRETAGWSEYYPFIFKKNAEYRITSVKTYSNGILDIQFKNSNEYVVPYTVISGEKPVYDASEPLVIKMQADASSFRAYFGGTISIERADRVNEIEDSLMDNINDVKALTIDYKEYSSASGWSNWFDCKFCKGQKYKVLAMDTTGLGILDLNMRNTNKNKSVAYTIISGEQPILSGKEMVFTPNEDVDIFRAYLTGTFSVERVSEMNNKNHHDGYIEKDSISKRIVVDVDGTGDYTAITSACNAITDASFENQYEIVVMPGVYHELNIIVPPFVHIHGLIPHSVVITSAGVDPISTLPVIDQRNGSSKLSNMEIVSVNGYCIHYDVNLDDSSLYNENLILNGQTSDSSIIGGGSFLNGAKYVWKNCTFISKYGKSADCHTNANKEYENTHLVFDSCTFINTYPKVGSVGGFGNCVCEITNCNFMIGAPGLYSWFSNLMNVDKPNRYRFNRNEWQIIGGGNKNLNIGIQSYGKTIKMTANYPIQISGDAARVIFGQNPKYVNNNTSRIPCSVTSDLFIDDSKAGLEPYSTPTDVYQLWKRLGDCSTANKTLTVTVNGVTKSYTFSQNYLSTKQSESSIISDMQVALTNVTISKIESTGYSYDNISLSDLLYVKISDEDILKEEFVTVDGHKATNTSALHEIAGVACDDAQQGDYVKVWPTAFKFYTSYNDGEYGLNSSGQLDPNASIKIGFIKNNIFYKF